MFKTSLASLISISLFAAGPVTAAAQTVSRAAVGGVNVTPMIGNSLHSGVQAAPLLNMPALSPNSAMIMAPALAPTALPATLTPTVKAMAAAPVSASPLAAIQSDKVADKAPALNALFDSSSQKDAELGSQDVDNSKVLPIEVAFDPANAPKGHVDEFESAMIDNREKLLSFLKTNYSITDEDIASKSVQLRILNATTVFNRVGHKTEAHEQYVLQLERKDAEGHMRPINPSFAGQVWWVWDQQRVVRLGLGLAIPTPTAVKFTGAAAVANPILFSIGLGSNAQIKDAFEEQHFTGEIFKVDPKSQIKSSELPAVSDAALFLKKGAGFYQDTYRISLLNQDIYVVTWSWRAGRTIGLFSLDGKTIATFDKWNWTVASDTLFSGSADFTASAVQKIDSNKPGNIDAFTKSEDGGLSNENNPTSPNIKLFVYQTLLKVGLSRPVTDVRELVKPGAEADLLNRGFHREPDSKGIRLYLLGLESLGNNGQRVAYFKNGTVDLASVIQPGAVDTFSIQTIKLDKAGVISNKTEFFGNSAPGATASAKNIVETLALQAGPSSPIQHFILHYRGIRMLTSEELEQVKKNIQATGARISEESASLLMVAGNAKKLKALVASMPGWTLAPEAASANLLSPAVQTKKPGNTGIAGGVIFQAVSEFKNKNSARILAIKGVSGVSVAIAKGPISSHVLLIDLDSTVPQATVDAAIKKLPGYDGNLIHIKYEMMGPIAAQNTSEAPPAKERPTKTGPGGQNVISGSELDSLFSRWKPNLAITKEKGPIAVKGPVLPSQTVPVIEREPLPKSSVLRQKTEELDAQWGDDNIMNGSVGTLSGRFKGVPSSIQISVAAKVILMQTFEEYESRKLENSVAASPIPLKDAIEKAVINLADGFNLDKSNPENLDGLREQISPLTSLLGKTGRVVAVSAKSTAMDENSDPAVKVNVGLVLFVNQKTGEYVAFYARQAGESL